MWKVKAFLMSVKSIWFGEVVLNEFDRSHWVKGVLEDLLKWDWKNGEWLHLHLLLSFECIQCQKPFFERILKWLLAAVHDCSTSCRPRFVALHPWCHLLFTGDTYISRLSAAPRSVNLVRSPHLCVKRESDDFCYAPGQLHSFTPWYQRQRSATQL